MLAIYFVMNGKDMAAGMWPAVPHVGDLVQLTIDGEEARYVINDVIWNVGEANDGRDVEIEIGDIDEPTDQ